MPNPILMSSGPTCGSRYWSRTSASITIDHSAPRGLLHGNPVRPRRSRGECGVEVHIKPRIQFQMIFEYFDRVNVVIALEMNLSEVVFVEEVVTDHQPLVVIAECNRVRTRIHAQVHNPCLERMFRVAHVEHANLSGLK